MSTYPQIVGDQNRPMSIHAEMTILGAMMVDPDQVPDALDLLIATDFALDSHRRIFAAMTRLAKLSQPIDIVTIMDELQRKKELDSVGGLPYLASLSEGLPRRLSIESYIRIVRDKSLARGIMNVAERGALEAGDGQEESGVVLERTIQELQELAHSQPVNDMEHVGTFLAGQGEDADALTSMSTTDGLMLGWTQWDEVTGGLQPGELTVLVAMASSGKTAWACNAVYYTSVVLGKVTAYFPLEDGRGAAVRRMISAASEVDHRGIRDGNLSPRDQSVVLEHRAKLAAAPLYLDDTPEMTMTRVKAKCAKLKRQRLAEGHPTGLDFVVIDQLSHIENTDVYQKNVNPEELIGRQAHMAKKLAKELNVPVVLLVQMTQEAAKRADPTPRITDIAGSGKVKNHADIVAFLHRPELFDKNNEALKGEGHMIFAKNRQGETKTCICRYRGRILKWDDDTPPTPKQTPLDYYRSAYKD